MCVWFFVFESGYFVFSPEFEQGRSIQTPSFFPHLLEQILCVPLEVSRPAENFLDMAFLCLCWNLISFFPQETAFFFIAFLSQCFKVGAAYLCNPLIKF